MTKQEYIDERLSELLQHWSGVAYITAAPLILSLSILDYYVTPSNFSTFLIYRIVTASLFMLFYALNKRKRTTANQITLLFLVTFTVMTMIELMVFNFGGHESPYFLGVVLTIIYVIGFIPMSIRISIYFSLFVYLFYLLPLLIYDVITNKPFFISVNVFLLSITFFSLVIKYYTQKTLISELGLKYELSQQQSKLEELVETRTVKLTETIEQLERSRGQLRNLSAHLESVREDERTRIAREIHDEMGQVLTALKMDISWLNKRFPQEKKDLLEKAHAMSEMIDATIKTVRKISAELRPGALDDLGLAAAIEWQAGEFQKRTGISCVLNITPQEMTLDRERSTTLFRIIQEILTNVARHAEATEVSIHLAKKHDKIELSVADNGKGIREEERDHPHSFGLLGMRERVHYWKGNINITGIPDKGTTIELSIPIHGNGEEDDSPAHSR